MIKQTGKLWSIHSDMFGACIVARILGNDGWVSFFCPPSQAKIVSPGWVVYRESICLGAIDTKSAVEGWRYCITLDLKSNLLTWELENSNVRSHQAAEVSTAERLSAELPVGT